MRSLLKLLSEIAARLPFLALGGLSLAALIAIGSIKLVAFQAFSEAFIESMEAFVGSQWWGLLVAFFIGVGTTSFFAYARTDNGRERLSRVTSITLLELSKVEISEETNPMASTATDARDPRRTAHYIQRATISFLRRVRQVDRVSLRVLALDGSPLLSRIELPVGKRERLKGSDYSFVLFRIDAGLEIVNRTAHAKLPYMLMSRPEARFAPDYTDTEFPITHTSAFRVIVDVVTSSGVESHQLTMRIPYGNVEWSIEPRRSYSS